ncbi:hypothetical protein JKP88DRAFT_240999 [Tribonema minus]|uniref:Uncharacterized protein n=1 Tax=Tribonema minus TaxID=303371 RepID=A0A835ZA70_9STRA|nr:hypothetical protein JKP88DRAFT_240999 [Tribonema minus]
MKPVAAALSAALRKHSPADDNLHSLAFTLARLAYSMTLRLVSYASILKKSPQWSIIVDLICIQIGDVTAGRRLVIRNSNSSVQVGLRISALSCMLVELPDCAGHQYQCHGCGQVFENIMEMLDGECARQTPVADCALCKRAVDNGNHILSSCNLPAMPVHTFCAMAYMAYIDPHTHKVWAEDCFHTVLGQGECDFCHSRDGKMIKCAITPCNAMMHASCAMERGACAAALEDDFPSSRVTCTAAAHQAKVQSYIVTNLLRELGGDVRQVNLERLRHMGKFKGIHADLKRRAPVARRQLVDDVVECVRLYSISLKELIRHRSRQNDLIVIADDDEPPPPSQPPARPAAARAPASSQRPAAPAAARAPALSRRPAAARAPAAASASRKGKKRASATTSTSGKGKKRARSAEPNPRDAHISRAVAAAREEALSAAADAGLQGEDGQAFLMTQREQTESAAQEVYTEYMARAKAMADDFMQRAHREAEQHRIDCVNSTNDAVVKRFRDTMRSTPAAMASADAAADEAQRLAAEEYDRKEAQAARLRAQEQQREAQAARLRAQEVAEEQQREAQAARLRAQEVAEEQQREQQREAQAQHLHGLAETARKAARKEKRRQTSATKSPAKKQEVQADQTALRNAWSRNNATGGCPRCRRIDSTTACPVFQVGLRCTDKPTPTMNEVNDAVDERCGEDAVDMRRVNSAQARCKEWRSKGAGFTLDLLWASL